MRFVYLATPYTHVDYYVRIERYEAALAVSARLVQQGDVVYSGIVLFHPVCERFDIAPTWDFWKDYLEKVIPRCDVVVVVRMPGWEKSSGIKAEVDCARRHNIPVEYIDP